VDKRGNVVTATLFSGASEIPPYIYIYTKVVCFYLMCVCVFVMWCHGLYEVTLYISDGQYMKHMLCVCGFLSDVAFVFE
jgi:hypothetical protein